MIDAQHDDNLLAPRPPKLLSILGVILFLLAIVVSPERLAALGPMRASLEHEIESVRNVAHLEVWFFRAVSLACALVCGGCVLNWRRLRDSKLVQHISNHPVDEFSTGSGVKSRLGSTYPILFTSIILSLVYFALAPRFLNADQLKIMNREEGVIESATAIIFFLCSIAALIIAFKFLLQRTYAFAAVHGIMALGFFLFAGEEISWGQRIFQLETLDYFAEHNVQGENNLHNLVGYLADHVFILGVFAYGFVLPILQLRYPFAKKAFHVMGMPIPSLGLALGFLILSGFHYWTIYRVFPVIPGLRVAEVRELLAAIAFALLLYESWSAARAMRVHNN